MDSIDLFRHLRTEYPKFDMVFHAFTSGAIMLDITTMDGVYVVEWSPSHPDEIGVSNAKNATFGHEGADKVFESFGEAQSYLDKLLDGVKSPDEVYGKPSYS